MEIPTRERADLEYVRDQGRLKTARDAVMLADTARLLRAESAIADAHAKKFLGELYQVPDGEEVIHVGDITVQHPPAQSAPTSPQATQAGGGAAPWLKTAGLLAAMAAAGAGGSLIPWLLRDKPQPAFTDTDTDTDTRTDFGLSQE